MAKGANLENALQLLGATVPTIIVKRGRLELRRLNRPADGPDPLQQLLEGGLEGGLVVAFDRRLELG